MNLVPLPLTISQNLLTNNRTVLSSQNKLIDFSQLSEMLYGEEKYIKEVSQAAVKSFQEFSEHYQKFLLARDESSFRKAGHKIKPVVQMMNIEQILDEYEHAKELLHSDASDKALKESTDKVTHLCTQVLNELKERIENP